MTSRGKSGYSPMENMLLNIGRLLLMALPAFQAWDKFKDFNQNVGFYGRIGLPAPEMMVMLTIALGAMVVLMLLFGVAFRLAVVLIGIFVLLDAVLSQVMQDGLGTELARYLFALDMATLGGCLAFLVTGPGDWSVSGRR